MSTPTPEQRAAIRKRLDEATSGPWWSDGFDGMASIEALDGGGRVYDRIASDVESRADAELIANAPTDLAMLLDALEAAEATIASQAAVIAQVREVRADLLSDSEGDQDWSDDPIGCIVDALDVALDGRIHKAGDPNG